MKNKLNSLKEKFIEFNNNTYGMLITVSWIVLIICLIIKLFGGNWFELGTDNENFVAFCNYVDNTMWLKMVLACGIYLISGYFILSVILNKKMTLKLLALFYPLMITKSILGWYILWLAYIIDFFIIVILPLILGKFRNWKRVIVVNVLIILFQFLTMAIRNLSIGTGFNENNYFIVQAIYQVDYYLMIILCFLYNFRKKVD